VGETRERQFRVGGKSRDVPREPDRPRLLKSTSIMDRYLLMNETVHSTRVSSIRYGVLAPRVGENDRGMSNRDVTESSCGTLRIGPLGWSQWSLLGSTSRHRRKVREGESGRGPNSLIWKDVELLVWRGHEQQTTRVRCGRRRRRLTSNSERCRRCRLGHLRGSFEGHVVVNALT
jgi:hypothetical protein